MPPAKTRLTSREIRQSFLDFFRERGHTIVPSASLVPGGDETLLFTNAGMVQFKDVFLGTGQRPFVRAADSQKCMRVAGKHNDLDDVGRDDTHHTFFEMLGNWSFGDYYKKEAIGWAWELLTERWGLPGAQLWAACFSDEKGEIPRDDEAADVWRSQPGMDPDHILFFGRKENFWEMADLGPCGPDTEVHLDRGPEFCDKQGIAGHVCAVNGDCQRFLELWNLVFIQYNRTGPTSLEPLPKKHVDTGMGFERIVSVLQDVRSNYDTDLFLPLLETVRRLRGHGEAESRALRVPYRVIADHARAAAFLIADGVVPGNTGRNYVCRMVIRRAARFGAEAGFEGPFLAEVARTVCEEYGPAYPELLRNQVAIEGTITDEEERFRRTVDTGLSRLDLYLGEAAEHGGLLEGERAFDLYSTYGLPLEISRDIARERGLEVDEAGFRSAMEIHRAASTGDGTADAGPDDTPFFRSVLDALREQGRLPAPGVDYNPYEALSRQANLVTVLRDGARAESIAAGEEGALVLDRTSFYIASGGQVADTGRITAEDGSWAFEVHDMGEPVAGLILHIGKVVSGVVKPGVQCLAAVDASRRHDIMRNHTATHLLHASLRTVLGEHARQAGSLVAPDRLRFDFTHSRPMTADEILRVQHLVTGAIFDDFPLDVREKPRRVAESEGAMALFGETYGETVRTISIGRTDRFSYELCGGTHVHSTGEIGPFLILREESVAAGIRRIEALTGRGAQSHFERESASLARIADELATTRERAEEQLAGLLARHREMEARLTRLERTMAQAQLDALPVESIGATRLLIGSVPESDVDALRDLSDSFRQQNPSCLIVLGSVSSGRPVLIASLSRDLVDRGLSAVELVKVAAEPIEGGGGGRAAMAQAGGKKPEGMEAALRAARRWADSRLTDHGRG